MKRTEGNKLLKKVCAGSSTHFVCGEKYTKKSVVIVYKNFTLNCSRIWIWVPFLSNIQSDKFLQSRALKVCKRPMI